MSFDVDEAVTSPWAFPTFDSGTFRTDIPILDYGNSPTKFERVTAFLQDSIELSDEIVLSIGTKFEDGDLSGTNFQPYASYLTPWMIKTFFGPYSRAHRQASLVEQYTKVSYARVGIRIIQFG